MKLDPFERKKTEAAGLSDRMIRPALLALALGVLALATCIEAWGPTARSCVSASCAPRRPTICSSRSSAACRIWDDVEGRNLVIEQRWAHGKYNDLPRLAKELVDLKVQVIFASCTPCALAARAATQTIPIVTVSGDPVSMGLAASLARPGGNITGFTLFLDEISVKRLEVLKEAVPTVIRVVVLWVASNPFWEGIVERMSKAAPGLGMRVRALKVLDPDDVAPALDSIVGQRVDALVVFEDPVLRDASPQILAFAAKHFRTPAIYGGASFVRRGEPSPTVPTSTICSDGRPDTSTGSSKARVPPTCRSSNPAHSSSPSTRQRPGRSALRFQTRSCSAPTR